MPLLPPDLPNILFNNQNNTYPNVICKIFSIDDFINFDIPKNSLSILTVNIRSMRRNFTKLQAFLALRLKQSLDIICITETWLNENIDNCFYLEGFNKYSIYRNKNGGGIIIFIKHFLTVSRNEILSTINDN